MKGGGEFLTYVCATPVQYEQCPLLSVSGNTLFTVEILLGETEKGGGIFFNGLLVVLLEAKTWSYNPAPHFPR